MSTESLAIVGLTLIALALPALGASFYQVFALKRELADAERRLEALIRETTAATAERVTRVENDTRAVQSTLQALSNDLTRETARIEGRLDELTARAREK